MIKNGPKINNLVFVLLLLFIVSSCGEQTPKKLPILGNVDVVYKTVDGVEVTDTIYPKIPPFSFLNEDSISVSNADFKNKVWIVEFFFATCPTICPIMNHELKRLHKEMLHYQNDLQFISFSIDPKHDLPSVLKKYKLDHRIHAKNWVFLTGNEAETHRLGIEHFLTFAGRDDDAAGGYAHSGSFTLVDKKGYVRGVYAVTNPDLSVNQKEYKRLKNDLMNLFNFEYHVK